MEGAVDGMSVHREDESMSPLEPLDPHRLRDMVVDQHSMAAGGHLQRMQSMQCFNWSPTAIPALLQAAGQSPIRGPSSGSNNSGSSPAAQRRRLSSGSDSHSMPAQMCQPTAFNEQQQRAQQQLNFAQSQNEIHSPNGRGPQSQMPPQTPLSMSGGMIPGQSPLGSPHAQHLPPVQSPFNRNTPGPSMTPSSPFGSGMQQQMQQGGMHMGPLSQQQPQTPGGLNQIPSNSVNMSPSANPALYSNSQGPRNVPYPNPAAQAQSHTAYPFPPNASQVPGAQQMSHQQWMNSQQQMQQHYVGQPRMLGNPAGQRVTVQRVPYPSGYNNPTAMTQAQPGYPRPARLSYPSGNTAAPAQQQPGSAQPSQRTPPSAVTSSPIVYPLQIQAAKEQQAAQQQAQQQQQQQNAFSLQTPPVPQTPQTPGAGGFPNALGYPAQAQVPQPTPRTPQTPQLRPSLMSAVSQPPQQHITSPHNMYPSGSVTPAQPTGFNPRFGPPVQGISPQYPNANDLRSPGLMSPNQSMRIPCMPGDPLVPNMMRVATQSSHFFGHDHQFSMPLDMCLMGCNFYLVENERSLYDKHDLANLSAVIKYHGGDLKWGNQGWNERTTHVLCESYQHPYVRNVLKEGRKRCVTLQWLNEVLIRKRMEAPWKFCHLPSFWNDVRRPAPGTSKTIAVSGYHEIELINVKMMISAIGARFTPHLSVENDFLISKGECLQVERARELGVRVLNYRWLQDAYTGLYNNTNNSNVYPDHENPLYILGSPEPCPEVTSTPYMMERYNDIYNKLLAPWKFPIVVNHEIFNVGMELRKSIENDENTFPYKKVKNLTPPPTDEQIVEARKVLKELAEPLPKVVICLSGMLPDDQKNLAKKAEFLGAQITTDVEKCTHFVCVSLFRTVDLMKAIALGKNVVSHNFIVYGYTILRFPDTYDLYLSDDENEKNYGYSLKNSIWRARKQPIFEDITFYVMPSVHPSRKILCDLIITAGGVVDDERPAPKYLAECVEYERPYFVIGCDADLHLYHYLVDCKFPIYNEEFVMMAILRQEFDTSAYYLVNTTAIPPAASTPSTPNQPRLPPAVNVNGTNNAQSNTAQRVKAQ